MSTVATRKRPPTANEELAEAQRRAKGARTPIAKAVTRQVVEKQKRTQSGQAAREASAEIRRRARTGGRVTAAPETGKGKGRRK